MMLAGCNSKTDGKSDMGKDVLLFASVSNVKFFNKIFPECTLT